MQLHSALPRRIIRIIRTYATRPRLNALSLDHFLQRARVLSFYRTILRSTRNIKDPAVKAETRTYARAEFERHRNVHDLAHIRYLLSTGKTEWQTMERYIKGMTP